MPSLAAKAPREQREWVVSPEEVSRVAAASSPGWQSNILVAWALKLLPVELQQQHVTRPPDPTLVSDGLATAEARLKKAKAQTTKIQDCPPGEMKMRLIE